MTDIAATKETAWRASGTYSAQLASKASLVEEARLFLSSYAQTGDSAETSKALIDTILPQRSRETRATIVNILRSRLVRWQPPSWVLDDLVTFARDTNTDTLRLALLLHTARQERVLYDFVQQIVVPRWYSGIYKVIRSDVQGFLDAAQEDHPEILGWSHTTREKLSRNALTVLRDGKLLNGEVNKHIVAPHVPLPVAQHLAHLLLAEGVAEAELVQHPDWQLWLWDEEQIRKTIALLTTQEQLAWRTT